MSDCRCYVHVQDHHGGPAEIIGVPSGVAACEVVSRWASGHWRTRWSGRPVAHSWRVLDASDLVSALVESARRPLAGVPVS